MRRLVLGIAVAVTSLMPIVGMADDQQIADFIKTRLEAEQQQGNLKGFNVDMRVEQGTVWFKGEVSNARQEMTILKTAQAAAHLGVLQVVDDIEVAAAVPATNYPSTTIPAAASQAPARQVAYQQGRSLVPAQTASFGNDSGSGVRAVPAQTASFGSGSGSRSWRRYHQHRQATQRAPSVTRQLPTRLQLRAKDQAADTPLRTVVDQWITELRCQ